MEIIEALESGAKTIEKHTGKGGLIAVICGLAAFGIYSYYKADKEESTLVSPTGYTSYPDVSEASDVVISTLQDTATYNQIETMDRFDSLEQGMQGNFDATNNYIDEGFDKSMENFDKLSGQIEDVHSDVNTVGNIAAMTYYEYMLRSYSKNKDKGRDRSFAALDAAGFNTGNEQMTNGVTTFKGNNMGG